MPNFSFLACLEVAEKFVVVWVGVDNVATVHSDPKGKSNGYVKTHVYNCMLYLYDTKTRSYMLDMK